MILENKISRVVVSVLDPNPEVAGKGVQMLRDHGVEVTVGVLEEEGGNLICKFRANLQKRPFVILKSVQSADGYIGIKGKQVWLSNPFTTMVSHKWRSESDAILVGTTTVLTDNPALTTRLWYGDNPVRILWDNRLQVPITAKIFNPDASVIVLNGLKEGAEGHILYHNTKSKSLSDLLHDLFLHGITSMIVEGGSYTLQKFIDEGLWDEARIVTTPQILGDMQGIPVKSVKVSGRLDDFFFMNEDKVEVWLNEASDSQLISYQS